VSLAVREAFRHPLGPAAEDVGPAQLNKGTLREPSSMTTLVWLLQPVLTRTHFLDLMDRYPASSIEFTT
jgi:hypothetical protein